MNDQVREHHLNNKLPFLVGINQTLDGLKDDTILNILHKMKNHSLFGEGSMSKMLIQLLTFSVESMALEQMEAVKEITFHEAKIEEGKMEQPKANHPLFENSWQYTSMFLSIEDIKNLSIVNRDTFILVRKFGFRKFRRMHVADEDVLIVGKGMNKKKFKNSYPCTLILHSGILAHGQTYLNSKWFAFVNNVLVHNPQMLEYIPLPVLLNNRHEAGNLTNLRFDFSRHIWNHLNSNSGCRTQFLLNSFAAELKKFQSLPNKQLRKIINVRWKARNVIVNLDALTEGLNRNFMNLFIESDIEIESDKMKDLFHDNLDILDLDEDAIIKVLHRHAKPEKFRLGVRTLSLCSSRGGNDQIASFLQIFDTQKIKRLNIKCQDRMFQNLKILKGKFDELKEMILDYSSTRSLLGVVDFLDQLCVVKESLLPRQLEICIKMKCSESVWKEQMGVQGRDWFAIEHAFEPEPNENGVCCDLSVRSMKCMLYHCIQTLKSSEEKQFKFKLAC